MTNTVLQGKVLLPACAMALCAAAVANADIPASAYVQTGLVAHWDGVDNVGTGTHDPDATSWTDLTTNGHNATVYFTGRQGYWSGRSLVSTNASTTLGVYASFIPSETLRTLLNSDGPWTIEIRSAVQSVVNGSMPFGRGGSRAFGWYFYNPDTRSYFYVRNVYGSATYGSRGLLGLPATYTYVHNGSTLKHYVSARQFSSVAAPAAGTGSMTAGDALNLLYAIKGELYAVRVYSRALSPAELKMNADIDNARFAAGGSVEGYAADESGETPVITVTVKAQCPAGTGTVSIDGGAAGTSVETNVAFGDSVSVTFAPADGYASCGWANAPSGTDTGGATITFAANGPTTLHALPEARIVHYVALTGSDRNAGTAASPWRTLNHANRNSAVKDFDEIRIGGGLYEEAVVSSICYVFPGSRPRLTYTGAYAADWTRDLVDSRTTVKPPTFTCPAMTFVQSFSNVVDGVDLTGGRVGYGFADNLDCPAIDARPYQYGTLFRHCFITNNTSHGIAAINVYATELAGSIAQPRQGFKCSSCFIADNGGYGFGSDSGDTQSAYRYFTNCTVTRNKAGGMYVKIAYSRGRTDCRNVILSGNGGQQFYCIDGTVIGYMRFIHTFVWSGSAAEFFSPVSSSTGYGVPILTDLFHRDPLLDDDGKPTAASYANKSGMDTDAVTAAPATDDIYGNAWEKGAYDVGCFKTAYPLPATRRSLAEVYVATNGADTAAGTSAGTALATLGEAMWRIRTNGVCHIGPGVYANDIAGASAHGITVRGAGPDATVIAGPGTNGVNQAAFYVSASNVVLVGCAFSNAVFGVVNQNDATCGLYFSATNCAFVCNRTGLRQFTYEHQQNFNLWIQYISKCRFTDNLHFGVYCHKRLSLESCLAARNGIYGIHHKTHDRDGESCYMNCTVADNGRYGVYKTTGNNGVLKIRNSIIAGNPTGVYPGNYGAVNWQYTLFDNATNEEYSTYSTYSGMTDSCITNGTHAGFVGTVTSAADKRYWLAPGSACIQAGSWGVYPWNGVTPSDDLIGYPRKADEPIDLGCYVFRLPAGLQIYIR